MVLGLIAPNRLGGQFVSEHNGFAWTTTYDERIHEAYRLIARHVYKHGGLGEFAYCAFDYINATFFAGRLPEPLILWDITDYGACLGWTRSASDGPPIIKLHPSTVYPADSKRLPWGMPRGFIGFRYAYHVLIHESIHAAVNYLHGGYENIPGRKKAWTSHNNPLWVSEVNRISILMGLPANYVMKRNRRVPTGEVDDKGRPVTKVKYVGDGPPFERFPLDAPGSEEFYRRGELPFSWESNRIKTLTAAASQ
jgi:hypothetical protein